MNIKVWDDKYIIKSDAYGYVVAEIKTKQAKDELPPDAEITSSDDGTYEINLAYIRDFSGCYRYIVDREGRKNKCTTLTGYIKHIEKVHKQLEEEVVKLADMFDTKEKFNQILTKLA